MRTPDKMETLSILRSRSVPIATVLDVGVHVETPELIAGFPDRPHILFEPGRHFADAIHRNYRNIRHTLVTAALSDKEGSAEAIESRIGGMNVITAEDQGDPDARRATVPMLTLDGYLARHPQTPPFLLKIDVDGYELPVLRGAVQTLKECSVVIVEAQKYEFARRLAFLVTAGFELFDLTEPCYYDKSFWQCDLVMLRKDIHREYFADLEQNFSETKYETYRRLRASASLPRDKTASS